MFFFLFDLFSVGMDERNGYQDTLLMNISELFLTILNTVVWGAYLLMFVLFMKLFKDRMGQLDSIKCQIMTFFSLTIAMLTVRMALHWFFYFVDWQLMIVNVRDSASE